jgi:hypothetical protein
MRGVPSYSRSMETLCELVRANATFGWTCFFADYALTGPNELMVLSLDALSKLHAADSRCRKSALFDIIEYKGSHSLHSLVDRQEHRDRRRVWERAMTEDCERSRTPVCRVLSYH